MTSKKPNFNKGQYLLSGPLSDLIGITRKTDNGEETVYLSIKELLSKYSVLGLFENEIFSKKGEQRKALKGLI